MKFETIPIQRALVAIFDIEDYSKKNPKEQAKMVETFGRKLEEQLSELEKCKPDVFSTGDGAIVTIGFDCDLDEDNVEKFIDFTINFNNLMIKNGLSIRTAINYAERDNAVIIKDSKYFYGHYIQTGDTINVAARIIIYCEPGEILLNKTVYKYLKLLDLDKKYQFYENKPIITKHNLILYTYSYIPKDDELIYNPEKSPQHGFKQYLYIPPIKTNIFNFFHKQGLNNELEKVISKSFESLKSINETQSFLSRRDIIDVLMQLEYDPDDTIYVISRNDREIGFWTQPRKEKYLKYIKSNKKHNNDVLNQVRVMVYDESGCQKIPEKDDIFFDLLEIHNDNTFYRLPASRLPRYENIKNLLFGATISKNHKFAIISIPEPETFGYDYPKLKEIGKLFQNNYSYKYYNLADGPMKAIITHNKDYIKTLIKEIESMIKKDPLIEKIDKKDKEEILILSKKN